MRLRRWFGFVAVLGLAAATTQIVNAQQNYAGSGDADLLNRLNAQEQRIAELETLLTQRQQPFTMQPASWNYDSMVRRLEVLESTVAAYRDVYSDRSIAFDCEIAAANMQGSPELLIQMLDKLVDNAVSFSNDGETININLLTTDASLEIAVTNPGPPLPDRMRAQLFDSMVSMRGGKGSKHLGLGLYVAKLIAEGHGGRIDANNVDDGVCFTVTLPRSTP